MVIKLNHKRQATSSKLDKLQAVGYYEIRKVGHMKLTFDEVMERVVTAINIQTGDDGHNAKKTMEIVFQLLKMTKKEYVEQVKYYG